MAGIDKTYGTWEDSLALYDWLVENKPEYVKYHYGTDEFYDLNPEDERPILNTPTHVDEYLAEHCPYRFVLERLIEVYGDKSFVYKMASNRLPFAVKTNYWGY